MPLEKRIVNTSGEGYKAVIRTKHFLKEKKKCQPEQKT